MIDKSLPGDSQLIMGILFADMMHGEIGSYLKSLTDDDLTVISAHTIACEPENLRRLNCLEAEWGLPLSAYTWWLSTVMPAIQKEQDIRTQPAKVNAYNGLSPIARFKASHPIMEVARHYTQLHLCGPGKFKGHCPIHQEQTASFYIYEDTQKYYCFGACASGGDVIDLLRALGEDIHW